MCEPRAKGQVPLPQAVLVFWHFNDVEVHMTIPKLGGLYMSLRHLL